MKIVIEIPPEFEQDYVSDKFTDFFNRIKADINANSIICGNYEKETAEMFIKAFADSEKSKSLWNPFPSVVPPTGGRYIVVVHEWTDGKYLPKCDNTYVKIMHYQISDRFIGWNYPSNVDPQAEADTHREVKQWMEIPTY